MALPTQQQQGVVLGTDRPIMPVVSMSGVGVGVATALQMNQVQSPMGTVQQISMPMIGGPTQVQAIPIMTQAPEQQQAQLQSLPQQSTQSSQQTDNSTMIISTPDRSQQNDIQGMIQQKNTTTSTTNIDDNNKTVKKEDNDTKENSNPSSQTETSKKLKEEIKPDDKSSNPLTNLANAVNSITNGNDEPSTASTLLSATSKNALPKALVKPQVLTHVIEGFVIQEGNLI